MESVLSVFRKGSVLPVAVRSSLLYTFFNAWPTSNRFQSYDTSCVFGCGVRKDRIEHYLLCPRVAMAAESIFHVRLGELLEPRLLSLFRSLPDGDTGMQLACFIDGVRHAYLWAKHHRHGDPSAAMASRRKVLQLRHPSLQLLFEGM